MDHRAFREGLEVNDQTRDYIRKIARTYQGNLEKTAKWIAKTVHIPIQKARDLVREATEGE